MTLWKTVFYLWMLIFLSTEITNLIKSEIHPINTAMLLLGLIGLFGLAYQKAIWARNFWKVLVFVLFVFNVILIGIIAPSVFANLDNLQTGLQQSENLLIELILAGAYILMHFITLFALFIYAFWSDTIWQEKN